jgi:hypothetical protein
VRQFDTQDAAANGGVREDGVMSMQRFTRLTNAFGERFENQCHMVAVHFMHYNFG